MAWIKPTLLLSLGALSLLLTLGACAPLATLNALAVTDGHTRVTDIAYGPLARQRFDLYRPEGPAPAAGWPTAHRP